MNVWRAVKSLRRNVLIKKTPQKNRPRERPHSWLDRVKKDILETENSKQLDDVMDRNGWKNLVEVCKRL